MAGRRRSREKAGVSFTTYPGLYHLFMTSTSPGTGLGTPADYQKPGHVTQPVIDDIAAWIAARGSAGSRTLKSAVAIEGGRFLAAAESADGGSVAVRLAGADAANGS